MESRVKALSAKKTEIKAVIFDLDNTLLDFVEAKIKACKAVIERIGKGNSEELLNYFLRGKHGFESHENIADYLINLDVYSDELYRECCEIYEKAKLENVRVYDGIKDVLETLKRKYRLAVVTDAENGHALSRLEKAGLKSFFDVIVSADMTGKRKPEPDSILLALERLGVEPEEAAIVGDSLRRDIEAGKRLGMLTIYAAYGDRNFFESRKGDADFVAEKPEDILRILALDC
ncbi:HAD-IIIA family hydrolase [Archaeoglobus sp.]|uniref:HAD family hydrolase n=1 Tax=Archaeoglobus sp. TaxID=1872626 RepID=UPI0024AA90C1|nr:HAD-IIIA family hydrolase [Archaeoglobus sp.]MDI3497038.1 putative hydrolase of the superfamily [Archaeoglobus sp.]